LCAFYLPIVVLSPDKTKSAYMLLYALLFSSAREILLEM